MSTFWKIVGIFAVIWLIWYWTGGPQRSTNIKPYLKYNYDEATINKSDASLESGVRDMLPVDVAPDSVQTIKDNLQNQNFTN